MAYTALYREWRPRIFDDVVGQEHISITLRNQIKNDRIAHAYLFCGTRGTGKTSTAKIMAKALNCLDLKEGEPCNKCDMCTKINKGLSIDVIEMDAASNNKVDNIRDLIDDVQYPPQEAKYKVYIMDEVHMLTDGAVNAFLKTLEEPPKRVVFILATTDPQKLPITILSRCQRFDFKRIRYEDISLRLRKIVKEQGVFADDSSLNLIARMSDGAMRDSLSILDQAIAMGRGKVDYEDLVEMLGLVSNENLITITDAVIHKNIDKSIRTIDEIVLSGKDIHTFIKDFITHFRNLLMIKVSNNPEEVLDMSKENMDTLKLQGEKIRIEEIMRCIRILQEAEEQSKWSKQSRVYLELAVIKMCKIEYDTSKEVMLSRINKLEEVIKQGKITVACESVTPVKESLMGKAQQAKEVNSNKDKSPNVRPVERFNENSTLNINMVKNSWRDILETIKNRRHMVIYASLLTGVPESCKDGVVEIKYEHQYAFNKPRLETAENKKIIEDIFSEILKERVKVKYFIEEEIREDDAKERILIETFGEDKVEIIDE
ncbi:DNA polymerase III subunit gamma/tau [Clostridium sp. MSJ-4]|uniref:DNA-directed DNA polymerase n=1 Tax=Clostridium simiarum TaxID=2841506 RepID=A0ABS6F4B0_9CLOT|nr:DNA polymerase III subunit gamma/tau [Clostridium simiarum]MBU5593356.1 DNA polymerase III subunit gamma/tau [Clostridium simiarum]